MKINFVPKEEIDPWMEEAHAISPDVKDTLFLALAFQLHCCIWSNDKALKEQQKKIRVFRTEEIVKMLSSQ